MNIWLSLAMGTVLGALRLAVKNEKKKEAIKQKAREIFETLVMAYPEFISGG